jgi:serine/threonine-protein kinase
LHRDLKPANVMLDGRGKVRLTDFGLAAAAADLSGTEVRSGTPLYQLPEQLAGREVTARSDLYALGLVLYELFTGRRAYADAKRDVPPSKPSSHVSGLSPAVERVILRCLEPDPADRLRSALEVLAGLPGSDPLAAALAAGETPSPKAVANALIEGGLHPVVALALSAAVVLGVCVVARLNDSAKLFRQVPLREATPEVQAHRARELLTSFGYSEPPAGGAAGYAEDHRLMKSVQRPDATPTAGPGSAGNGPAAMYFWYRQSPDALTWGSGWGCARRRPPAGGTPGPGPGPSGRTAPVRP